MKTFDPSTHRAKKRFGQNFLHDMGIIDRIVHSIRVKADDNIIEIGPGLGAITKQLLAITKSINVIELDRDIIPKLKFNCDGLGDLNIMQTDALKVDFSQFSDKGPQGNHRLKLITQGFRINNGLVPTNDSQILHFLHPIANRW